MSRPRPVRLSPLGRFLSFPRRGAGRKRGVPPPSEEELLFELAGHNPGNLLFGRFGQEEIRDRIRDAGILEGLARGGSHEPLLALECEDPEDQRVGLYAGKKSRDRLLMEVRVQIRSFRPERPIGPFSRETVFRVLLIHWLFLSL